jgi:two-component system OmpR family sensor kinase
MGHERPCEEVRLPRAACETTMDAMDGIPLRRATVEVGELVASALRALKRDADKREVSLTIEAAKCTASVDPEKIGWAVATLVGNAMRYVRAGTRLHPGGSIAVSIEKDDPASLLRIVVRDDGPGIPEAVLKNLLERGDGKHAPALGLLLIRDVIEAHGGTMHVSSTTDPDEHGTTVEIALPAS